VQLRTNIDNTDCGIETKVSCEMEEKIQIKSKGKGVGAENARRVA
jgi:hypothetical protein